MSVFLEWSDDLSVGIEEIDAQHKELVGLVNKVYDGIQAGDRLQVNQVLMDLIAYTRTHFAVEESLMRLLHYPAYEAHKALHEALVDRVMDIKARVELEQAEVGEDLMELLKDWLTQHILHEDKLYVPFFVSAGAKPKLVTQSLLSRLRIR